MSDNGNGNGRRAVLYARCSGDDRGQEGRNLASQLELARQYAQGKGYTVVEEIAEDDRGASGAAFELAGLSRIREMAAAGDFDVLVPRELDRLSRNLAKQLIVEEELKRVGVGIEYALYDYPDTPEGNLMKNVRASFAEFEREKIAERVTRGRNNKIKAGHVVASGSVPYGYRSGVVDGKNTLVPYEPEAKIVRLVFLWYVCGDEAGRPLTLGAIARKLEGVPTHADAHGRPRSRARGHWSKPCIAFMLKNETYCGLWHFGRRNTRAKIVNPSDHVLSVEVPAIVDRELWQAAQERLVKNREQARRNRKNEYLLSGRVTCGTCEAKMSGIAPVVSGKKTVYYKCRARIAEYSTVDCTLPYFRADQVDAVVWDWVKELLGDPAALEVSLAEYLADRDRINEPIRARLEIVDDLLADNRSQLARLLDLYLAGDFDRELLTERKTRLETTIRALDKERVGLAAQLERGALTPAEIQNIRDFAAKAAQGLARAETDFEERRGLLEDLNFQAVLAIEDGFKVARVSCVFGRKTLSIASNVKYDIFTV